MTATLTAERCQTCLGNPAAWLARRNRGVGYGTWLACDRCRRSAVRLRSDVIYSPIPATLSVPEEAPAPTTVLGSPLRPLDAPTDRVGADAPVTSRAMAQRALPRSGTFRSEVYEAVRSSPNGMTDFDLERVLDRTHQSVSACRNGLVRDGWLRAAGTRPNQHGNDATIWRAT